MKKGDNEICRNCLSNPTQDDEIALQCWNMSLFSRQTFADRVVSVEGGTIELSGGFRAPHGGGKNTWTMRDQMKPRPDWGCSIICDILAFTPLAGCGGKRILASHVNVTSSADRKKVPREKGEGGGKKGKRLLGNWKGQGDNGLIIREYRRSVRYQRLLLF